MGCILSPDGKSQLSNTSNPVKKTASTEVRAFKVTVQRAPGEKLGLELGTLDGKNLLVISVKPGLVMELNKTHPETPISAGDFILSVNGTRDSVDAMKSELTAKDAVELVVAPFSMLLKKNAQQGEDQASSTSDVTVKIENKKAIDLGLQLASFDGSTLQVVGIIDGFFKSHNEMAPEAGICVGDTIAALHVDDTTIEGDARKLLIALAKLGSGVLTLRRKASEPPAELATEQKQEEETQKEPEGETQPEATPVVEPVQEAVKEGSETLAKGEGEEADDAVQPIQQVEEDKVSSGPPVLMESAQVRRGGLFGACCAPKVDAGEVEG